MRYSGKPAAFLRGFRAVYLGLLMNCLILGWVTKAMVNIISTAMGVSDAKALAICVFFLMPFTGIYVSLGGLWGVLWTDLFQFVLKMAIVIGVAWYGVHAAGGMQQMLATLAAKRAADGPGASDITALLPDFSRGITGEALWTLPVITFVVHLAVQWWAFWYPGAEPGGGGYIAQRIFSAKDERNGLLSVLWFNLAHYALRPWPWILTALAAVVLYPGLAQPETRLHAGGYTADAARIAGNFAGGIYGGVHVHGGDAIKLGKFVFGGGFLSAIHEQKGKRSALRARLAVGHGFPGAWPRHLWHGTCNRSAKAGKSCWNSAQGRAASTCCAGIGGA